MLKCILDFFFDLYLIHNKSMIVPPGLYLWKMYNKQLIRHLLILLFIAVLIINSGYFYKPAKIIQVDVDSLLNGRCVTTFTNGKLVTWSKGIDKENGYLTMAAAVFNGDKDPHALPDNPLFTADKHHPEILLHYSNEDGIKNQIRCLQDTGEFLIKVPAHNYSDLYLTLTSSYGPSSLQYELFYKDGDESKNYILPDWFKDIPDNDPDLSYVAHNMGKWGSLNNLKEKDHHNIDALNIHPDAKRILTAIKLKKSVGGYLIFWAATGVIKN